MRKLTDYTPTKFMAKDSRYDADAADYAVGFIECLCHTKGTWAGKPFELIDWQERIIRDWFGIIKPNGYRQFNTAYVEIPKKQGNRSLPQQSLFSFVAGTARNERRFTAVPLTASKPPSYSRLPPIWCGCVLPWASG